MQGVGCRVGIMWGIYRLYMGIMIGIIIGIIRASQDILGGVLRFQGLGL